MEREGFADENWGTKIRIYFWGINRNSRRTTNAYDAATLVLDTETIAYDLNTDDTPELTRVIDRSQDSLLRSAGYTLGAPISVGVL